MNQRESISFVCGQDLKLLYLFPFGEWLIDVEVKEKD